MVTVQLDVSALEFFIEQQGETFKLELKQAVLEEVGRRVVKSVLPEKFQETIANVVKDSLDSELGSWVQDKYKYKLVLNPTHKEAVSDLISRIVDEKLTSMIMEKKGFIESKVEASISAEISSIVKDKVNKILSQTNSLIEDALNNEGE